MLWKKKSEFILTAKTIKITVTKTTKINVSSMSPVYTGEGK